MIALSKRYENICGPVLSFNDLPLDIIFLDVWAWNQRVQQTSQSELLY